MRYDSGPYSSKSPTVVYNIEFTNNADYDTENGMQVSTEYQSFDRSQNDLNIRSKLIALGALNFNHQTLDNLNLGTLRKILETWIWSC